MARRILIVEQDPGDPNLWGYNPTDEEGRLPKKVYVLRDMADGGPSDDDLHEASLWTTAFLLVRQAEERTRIVYDLQPWLRDAPPEPPPRPTEKRWERSMKGQRRTAVRPSASEHSGSVTGGLEQQRDLGCSPYCSRPCLSTGRPRTTPRMTPPHRLQPLQARRACRGHSHTGLLVVARILTTVVIAAIGVFAWPHWFANGKEPAVDNIRDIALKLSAGVAAAFAAVVVWGRLELSKSEHEIAKSQERRALDQQRRSLDQQQLALRQYATDLFTKAVEQLGHKEPAVRMGGLYSLAELLNPAYDQVPCDAESV